jgi:hypothetical protein
MSYYILPKKSDSLILKCNKFKLFFSREEENVFEHEVPYISNSIYNYIQSLEYEITLYSNEDEINKLKNKINPYYNLIQRDFLNINKNHSEIFFNYVEILKIANFFDIYTKQEITLYSLNTEIDDAFMFYNKLNNISYKVEKNLSKEMIVDMLCFDIDCDVFETYLIKFFSTLCKSILHQSQNGNCIIKIGDIMYKPVIDILYIFSSLYEKVYILKPNTSNVFNNERYIVCKNFRLEKTERNNYYTYFNSLYLNMIINKKELVNKNCSIILNEIPCYFLNKIEDSNIGIGSQKIEHLDILISLLNNKYNSEKIDCINKNNIHKCILWCEKHKINYNKINEKQNIFMNEILIN